MLSYSGLAVAPSELAFFHFSYLPAGDRAAVAGVVAHVKLVV